MNGGKKNVATGNLLVAREEEKVAPSRLRGLWLWAFWFIMSTGGRPAFSTTAAMWEWDDLLWMEADLKYSPLAFLFVSCFCFFLLSRSLKFSYHCSGISSLIPNDRICFLFCTIFNVILVPKPHLTLSLSTYTINNNNINIYRGGAQHGVPPSSSPHLTHPSSAPPPLITLLSTRSQREVVAKRILLHSSFKRPPTRPERSWCTAQDNPVGAKYYKSKIRAQPHGQNEEEGLLTSTGRMWCSDLKLLIYMVDFYGVAL